MTLSIIALSILAISLAYSITSRHIREEDNDSDWLYGIFIEHGTSFNRCTSIEEVKINCDLFDIDYNELMNILIKHSVYMSVLIPKVK